MAQIHVERINGVPTLVDAETGEPIEVPPPTQTTVPTEDPTSPPIPFQTGPSTPTRREQLDQPLQPQITLEDMQEFFSLPFREQAQLAGEQLGETTSLAGGFIPGPARFPVTMLGGGIEGISRSGGDLNEALKGAIVEGGIEALGSLIPFLGRGLVRGGVHMAGRAGPAGREIGQAFVDQNQRMIDRLDPRRRLTFGDVGETRVIRGEVGEQLARRQEANPTRIAIEGGPPQPTRRQRQSTVVGGFGGEISPPETMIPDPVRRGGGKGPGLRGFTGEIQDRSRFHVDPSESPRQLREGVRGQETSIIRNLQEERGIRELAEDLGRVETGPPAPIRTQLERADELARKFDPADVGDNPFRPLDDASVRDFAELAAESGVQARRFFDAAAKGHLQGANAAGHFAAALRQRVRNIIRELDPDSEPFFKELSDLRAIEEAIESAGLGETVFGQEFKTAVRGGLGAGVGKSIAQATGLDPSITAGIAGPAAMFGFAASPVQRVGVGLMRQGPRIPTAVRLGEEQQDIEATDFGPDVDLNEFINRTLLRHHQP